MPLQSLAVSSETFRYLCLAYINVENDHDNDFGVWHT